jgi:hypothetical protein
MIAITIVEGMTVVVVFDTVDFNKGCITKFTLLLSCATNQWHGKETANN